MALREMQCVHLMPKASGFDDLYVMAARKTNRRCGADLLRLRTSSLLNNELTEISVYSDQTLLEPFRY